MTEQLDGHPAVGGGLDIEGHHDLDEPVPLQAAEGPAQAAHVTRAGQAAVQPLEGPRGRDPDGRLREVHCGLEQQQVLGGLVDPCSPGHGAGVPPGRIPNPRP